MPFHIDFSEVPEWEVVPKGMYIVEVKTAEETYAQSSGDAMLALRLEIIEGDDPSTVGQFLFASLKVEGAGLQITRQAFKALFGEAQSGQYDTSDLIGRRCRVRVTHRVYREEDGGDGEARANISRWYPLSDAELMSL